MNEELQKALNNASELKNDIYFFSKKLENTIEEMKNHVREVKEFHERLEKVLGDLYYEL